MNAKRTQWSEDIFVERVNIVTALKSLDVAWLLHGRKRQQLQNLFRTLLHELMTAKTRVHKLNISP
ncbi:MAG: hypothetical protein KDK99_14095 [Verrucomicrobiales bacterium]|nr:hypothetical protein [Verrucomicrobiales bacterium]